MRCPRCRVDLVAEPRSGGRFDQCPRCRGVAVTAALLRRFAPPDRVRAVWINAPAGKPGAACPSCARPMIETPVGAGTATIDVDVCRPCQLMWFDAEELAAFSPARQAPTKNRENLSPAAAEMAAIAHVETANANAEDIERTQNAVAALDVLTLLSWFRWP